MNIEIIGKPDFSLAKVLLISGESISAESGAMVAMSSGIEIDTGMRGGIFEAAKRSLLGGESFFMNTFTARSGGMVLLAPGAPGDIINLPLNGEIFVQKDGYLAGSPSIKIETKFQGLGKGLLSGEGFFILKCSGSGVLLLSSYGAIEEIEVNGEYIVDTGHIVAFDSTLNYSVEKLGNWKATILSGEFFVCRFSGHGKVYIQSRAVRPFAHWIHPFRRVKSKND